MNLDVNLISKQVLFRVVHLNVKRTFAGSIECGFFETLGKGWMRVAYAANIFGTGAELHGYHGLCYQVGCSWTYHVYAQNFIRFLMSQYFD
jgi:hypothetical protein